MRYLGLMSLILLGLTIVSVSGGTGENLTAPEATAAAAPVPPPQIDSVAVAWRLKNGFHVEAHVVGSGAIPNAPVIVKLRPNLDNPSTPEQMLVVSAEANGMFRARLPFPQASTADLEHRRYEVLVDSNHLKSRSGELEIQSTAFIPNILSLTPQQVCTDSYLEHHPFPPAIIAATGSETQPIALTGCEGLEPVSLEMQGGRGTINYARWHKHEYEPGKFHYYVKVKGSGAPLGECLTVSFDEITTEIPNVMMALPAGAKTGGGAFCVVFFVETRTSDPSSYPFGVAYADYPFSTVAEHVQGIDVITNLETFLAEAQYCIDGPEIQ